MQFQCDTRECAVFVQAFNGRPVIRIHSDNKWGGIIYFQNKQELYDRLKGMMKELQDINIEDEEEEG